MQLTTIENPHLHGYRAVVGNRVIEAYRNYPDDWAVFVHAADGEDTSEFVKATYEALRLGGGDELVSRYFNGANKLTFGKAVALAHDLIRAFEATEDEVDTISWG